VSLPAPFDGYSAVGMKGELKISEQVAPGAANGQMAYAFTSPDLGKPSEALVTMPEREDGAAYLPCFEYTVTDASNHDIITSFCASSAYPLPSSLVEDTNPPDPEPPHAPRTSTACSFAPAPAAGLLCHCANGANFNLLVSIACALSLLARRLLQRRA
jgi:hypothetical protein